MESTRTSDGVRAMVAVRDDVQRKALASLLSRFEDVDVVALEKDAGGALKRIQRAGPDLVFLDRSMLTLRQLQSVRRLLACGSPIIAFVMTRPVPIEAFEPNAIDYLLLPATVDRARQTLERAKERLDAASYTDAPPAGSIPTSSLRSSPAVAGSFLERIPVRTREGFKILPVAELVSVVAHREYMHLTMIDGGRHIILYRLKDLEARLNPGQFTRLSRSTLVNLNFISQVVPAPSGLLTVALRNGDEHKASRRRARALKAWLLKL